MKFFKKIIKEDELLLLKYSKLANKVTRYAKLMRSLSDEELKAYTRKFKRLLKKKKKTIDQLIPRVFAVAREASWRVRKEFPYYCQILGAIILYNGDVAEMKTGEGKTLTSIMTIYLNSLSEKRTVIVTTNEYLSQRDAQTIGEVLDFLGISWGWCSSEHTIAEKRNAYSKMVTYVTNSEFGFDYLRDNMTKRSEDKVLREFSFCIVDECDSVLIDEARTPLIIAGGERKYKYKYEEIDVFVTKLSEDDYIYDAESESINLSSDGKQIAEQYFSIENLYSPDNDELIHLIVNALKSNFIFEKGVQYIIKEEKILLVDKSTGRIMHGRTYSDGLHQSIEAKEKLEITPETTIIATITYQNLFRLFSKMSGMTGTAKTEEDEFHKIYNMRVIPVPTNMPLIRVDAPDYIFQNANAKFKALLEEIEYRHKIGQPILIGTRNVDDSEHISSMLGQLKIKHEILNAKNNALEAKIIANAGQYKQVTISTNMAGRGTDIKLSKKSASIGGLCMLATDRHESRRIDNQLRGRAGRQGDPGFTRFFLSLEDELIIRFGGNKLRKLFSVLGDTPLESRLVSRRLNQAQKRIEGMNFDSRKNLLEYDNVLSQQREIMYRQRTHILDSDNLLKILINMVEGLVYNLATDCYYEDDLYSDYNYEKFLYLIEGRYIPYGYITKETLKKNANDIVFYVTNLIFDTYYLKRKSLSEEIALKIEKQIMLDCFDYYWTTHIDNMMKLRSGIYLRSYGQKNPLQQYVEESAILFKEMKNSISHSIIVSLNTYTPTEEFISKIDNQVQEQMKVKIN